MAIDNEFLSKKKKNNLEDIRPNTTKLLNIFPCIKRAKSSHTVIKNIITFREIQKLFVSQ
jgi:hypothetical protein